MGTTLTGTTPQDTYDSLIKVTDNGPLSGSLKTLTDGLGNDSALALSTGAATITGTLGVSNRLSLTGVGTSELYTADGSGMYLTANTAAGMYLATEGAFIFRKSTAPFTEYTRITNTGNVGIGTSAPTSGGVSSTLRVKQASDAASGFTGIGIESAAATGEILYFGNTGTTAIIGQTYLGAGAYQPIAFSVSGSERFRITNSGVTFNGDTAAANALDDYEEGDWTVTITPETSGTITLNASFDTGQYTKIGRQVTVTCLAVVSSVSSPVGNAVLLSGFPFASGSSVSYRGSASVTYYNNPAYEPSQVSNIMPQNTDRINIELNASTIVAGDEFIITHTYFV